MKLISILLILILFNCFSLFNKGIISPLFDDKKEIEKYKNEISSCDANSYNKLYFNKLELKTTSEKLRTPSAFIDLISGYYGVYYFYPNGLKMFASLMYGGSGGFFLNKEVDKNFYNSRQSFYKNCDSYSDIFFNQEIKYTIELDLKLKENSQIENRHIITLENELKNKCIKHLPKVKEGFYISMFDSISPSGGWYNKNLNPNLDIKYDELFNNQKKLNIFKQKFLKEIEKENLEIYGVVSNVDLRGNFLDCEVRAFIDYKDGIGGIFNKYLLPELN